MSTTLSKALEFANYRTTLNNQKQALKVKTQGLLMYSINGGTFSVDRELITFCKMLLDQEEEFCVLLDDYENPIRVELESFYDEILSRYNEATNEYYVEYEKLKKARSIQNVLDLNDDI